MLFIYIVIVILAFFYGLGLIIGLIYAYLDSSKFAVRRTNFFTVLTKIHLQSRFCVTVKNNDLSFSFEIDKSKFDILECDDLVAVSFGVTKRNSRIVDAVLVESPSIFAANNGQKQPFKRQLRLVKK